MQDLSWNAVVDTKSRSTIPGSLLNHVKSIFFFIQVWFITPKDDSICRSFSLHQLGDQARPGNFEPPLSCCHRFRLVLGPLFIFANWPRSEQSHYGADVLEVVGAGFRKGREERGVCPHFLQSPLTCQAGAMTIWPWLEARAIHGASEIRER